MSAKDDTPLRGEAAWKAAKQAITKRNEAAYARGRKERAATDAEARDRRLQRDRAELASLPEQRGDRG